MWMDGQRHAPAPLPQGKKPVTHCIGGWVGPRAGLKGCGKSSPHRHRFPDRPTPGQSLYPLRYRSPLTLLHCLINVLCLQKNPVYIRPWLGFKFFCLQVSLIIDIAYSIRIVDYLGNSGIILIIMLVIKTGKDLVRIL